MDKVCVSLENCYGIKSLKYDFDFSQGKAYFIYASNGSMKTSFAKVFEDIYNKKDSQDLINENKKTIRNVIHADGKSIDSEYIFVVNSYDGSYEPKNIATLLANKSIKQQYSQIFANIEEHKKIIIKNIQESSGLKTNTENIMSKDMILKTGNKSFLEQLLYLKHDVDENHLAKLSHINYGKVFNDKTELLFTDKDFLIKLNRYLETYKKLIERSTFFKNGVFDHENATDVLKNLETNGFFRADHSIFLNGSIEIKNKDELEQMIDSEKIQILQNEELKKAFADIENKLNKNKDTKEFKDYVKKEQNQVILTELTNIPLFKINLWLSYLQKYSSIYNNLVEVYEINKPKLEQISRDIKAESSKWQNVIDKFNKRFIVPFVLDIENKEDVVLRDQTPNTVFKFGEKQMEKGKVLTILSQGEKRALYLLNILFEIEIRMESKIKTLFIIDDIADSFDYQNKYAIIEYLKEMSMESNFYLMILSHNYDFYRAVSNRLMPKNPDYRKFKLYATKSDDMEIILKEEYYQNNPFEHWKNNIEKEIYLIALIPFVRNLVEYCRDKKDNDYKLLTSLLHIKSDTKQLTIQKLVETIKNTLKIADAKCTQIKNLDKFVLNVIYETASKILHKNEESMELEQKIVLSIAIRLKTESFIIDAINDNNFVSQITKNQTVELIDKYQNDFGNNTNNKLFEKVRLMTSENIHVNSFMYEPLIDMSNSSLKKLYAEISKLAQDQ